MSDPAVDEAASKTAPARIIVADDDPSSRYLLQSMLSSAGFTVTPVEDGAEALDAARREPPDLVISDILMPQMDGYQLCREWRADPMLAPIPFIYYTANYTEPDDERFALSLGADRFLLKPMDPADLLGVVQELLRQEREGTHVTRAPQIEDEARVLKEYNARLVSKLEHQLIEVQDANESLMAMVNGTVRAIAKLAEARDPYTSGHQERVAALAAAIAEQLGETEDACEGIRIAGLVHDIGKIYVPAEILTKPRRLTAVEFAIIKMHPEVAHDVLSGIEFPWPVADYVVQHHERMDGSGYPGGLSGDDILPGARILAVADVVEAMSSHRPYKVAAGLDAALDEVAANSGVLYDAEVSAACLSLFREQGYEIPAATESALITV